MRCCLRSVFMGMLLGIALLIVAGLGLYLYAYPRLDSALSDAVRREYMLPPSSTIRFKHGTFLDTYQGKLESFVVEAKEAKLEGLVVNDVNMVATGIQFDMTRTLITGEAELRKVEHARLKFRVSEEALAEHWGDTLASRGIKDVDVDLRDKEIAVSGKLDLKLTSVPVAARGVFETDGPQKIRMRVNELSLGDSTLPLNKLQDIPFGKAVLPLGQLKDRFTKSIRTPVFDLGELKMGVNVTRLEPRNGYLYVEAESTKVDDLAKALHESEKQDADKQTETDDAAAGKSPADKVSDTVKDATKTVKKLGGKLKKIL